MPPFLLQSVKNHASDALCYSEGKTEESLKYLVRFVEVAERSKQDMALATACSNLGYIYNSRVCLNQLSCAPLAPKVVLAKSV